MKNQLSFKQKYQIILNKDSSYEGILFTAVKTTGIFCRPSCTARKPKIENVLFYDSVNQALENGFRPCKVCKPTQQEQETPDYIHKILKELSEDPLLKITDNDLKGRNIEPNKIRRWFKRNYQMTFQSYQRKSRINRAHTKISKGEKITSTAFDVGFDSLSGFTSRYQDLFGKSATQTNKNIINIIRLTTPLGPMFGCATKKGICLFEFYNRKELDKQFIELAKKLNAVILPGENEHLKQLQKQVEEYFKGERKTFTLTLDIPGTEFQNNVWSILQKIPYGKTISYFEIALKFGYSAGTRVVGKANAQNPIPIIIPCHRVINKNGQLAGYAGGLERKDWLLRHENPNYTHNSWLFSQYKDIRAQH